MRIDLTIKNYRCFPESCPLKITIQDGFTSFIGPNNSGKSSILRFFYEFRPIFVNWIPNSGAVLEVLRGASVAYGPASNLLEWTEVLSNLNDRDLEIDVKLPDVTGLGADGCELANRVVITVSRSSNTWTARVFNPSSSIPNISPTFGGTGTVVFAGGPITDLTQVFNAFGEMTNTLYIGPFRNAVNLGGSNSYFDIQIGQPFITTWKRYKSGNSRRDNEACHGLTEDIKRIFGYDDLDISASPDDSSLKIMINGKSFALHEVGSGLTQFIIVLANAAIRKPSYILIDEPELGLHPSLQLDFLTTLASHSRNGIIFTTHSIGLARSSSDKIYSVRRAAQSTSEVRDYAGTPRLGEFLGELSFSGYKELGFKKILLVEGRTEVKTFQQFLRLLKKDHEIVLIPMGGRELINAKSEPELAELTRISDSIAAVIDSERLKSGDKLTAEREGFVAACKNVKIECKVLDLKATENYFPDAAVKTAYGPKYRALAPFEDIKTPSPSWGKPDNWRIAREMSLAELLAGDLGQFLKQFAEK